MILIPLTQGRYAIIDVADYDLVSPHKWYYGDGYAMCHSLHSHNKIRLMHRLIMNAESNREIDHINRNTLDNRRSNLRFATRQQNCANKGLPHKHSSRFKGVKWNKRDHCWQACIKVDGVPKSLGYYTDEVEAARAYNKAAQEHFGEYAYLNPL